MKPAKDQIERIVKALSRFSWAEIDEIIEELEGRA